MEGRKAGAKAYEVAGGAGDREAMHLHQLLDRVPHITAHAGVEVVTFVLAAALVHAMAVGQATLLVAMPHPATAWPWISSSSTKASMNCWCSAAVMNPLMVRSSRGMRKWERKAMVNCRRASAGRALIRAMQVC